MPLLIQCEFRSRAKEEKQEEGDDTVDVTECYDLMALSKISDGGESQRAKIVGVDGDGATAISVVIPWL